MTVQATDIDDGTYSLDYTVLQAANESVSIANDYFQKPATFITVNGKQFIELKVNHSEWVQYLKVKEGDSLTEVAILEEDEEEDTRTVRFSIQDVSQPTLMQMHIRIEMMNPVYDHQYTVRFAFDESSIEWIGAAPDLPDDVLNAEKKPNRQLNVIYALIAIAVVFVFIFVIRSRKNNER